MVKALITKEKRYMTGMEWMNMEKFKEHDLVKENETASGTLLLHENCVEKSEIKATPTILISGFEMPRQYKTN